MKAAIISVLTLIVSGCDKEAVSISTTNNNHIQVDYLFENEGCKVFRFNDSGRNHYYANCKKSTTVLNGQTRTCGKGCAHTEDSNVNTNYY